jgi:hypothetical protein
VDVERLQQLLGGAALLGARGGEHARRDPVDAPEQVEQPAHRGLVGPLHVVDAQQQRLAGGQLGGQPVEAVQRRGRGVDVLERRAGADQHRFGERGRAAQQAGALVGVGAREDRLEQLARDAEAEAGLELRGARGQHSEPGRLRLGPARGEQPRLADARRTLEQHRLPGPVAGGRAEVRDRRQLPLPLQQPGPWVPIHRCAL